MLPLALLGIRTTLKEDLKCTAADLVCGTSLRLPGEFFVPQTIANPDPASYVTHLLDNQRTLVVIWTTLSAQPHMCYDAVRKPLQPPYDGPYCVLNRSDCSYMLDVNGRTALVSVDRLKPAHVNFPITSEMITSSPSTSPTPIPLSHNPLSHNPLPLVLLPKPAVQTTCSDRHVHWPTHLRDFTP